MAHAAQEKSADVHRDGAGLEKNEAVNAVIVQRLLA